MEINGKKHKSINGKGCIPQILLAPFLNTCFKCGRILWRRLDLDYREMMPGRLDDVQC